MSSNALGALLEVFFTIFLFADTHTDTVALFYPCCTCAREVTTVYFCKVAVLRNFSLLPSSTSILPPSHQPVACSCLP